MTEPLICQTKEKLVIFNHVRQGSVRKRIKNSISNYFFRELSSINNFSSTQIYFIRGFKKLKKVKVRVVRCRSLS